MASGDATPFPVKNQAYRVTFPILDADGDLVTGAAGLDSEVSKDAGAFADVTAEATEIATSSGMYYLDLTATEMNADTVAIIVKTSTSGAKTTPIVLYPAPATRGMAGTALPAAASNAAGGVPVSTAGGLDLDTKLANTNEVTAARMGALTDLIDGGRLDLLIDAILLDTGTTLDTKINDIQGGTFSSATDSLEAIRDRGDAAWTTGAAGSDRLLLADTTIATLATQTSFTLTAGSADNDAYNNCTLVVEDAATATQKAVGVVLDYVGATKTVTLKEALAFTIATTDKVYILAENALKSTVANRQLDVTAAGEAGLDLDNTVGTLAAAQFAADFITAAKIAPGAIAKGDQLTGLNDLSAAQVNTEADTALTDYGANTTTPPTVGAIADQVWDEAQADHVAAGSFGITASEIAALQTDLDNATDGLGALKALIDTVNTDLSNATDGLGALKALIDAVDNFVDTEIADIQARLPAALVGGRMDSTIDGTGMESTAVQAIADVVLPKKNTALSNVEFLMVLTSDDITPATGKTVTGTRSIDGGAFGAVSGTIAEVGNGIYQFDAAAADMNGGIVTFRFVNADCNDTFLTIRTGG